MKKELEELDMQSIEEICIAVKTVDIAGVEDIKWAIRDGVCNDTINWKDKGNWKSSIFFYWLFVKALNDVYIDEFALTIWKFLKNLHRGKLTYIPWIDFSDEKYALFRCWCTNESVYGIDSLGNPVNRSDKTNSYRIKEYFLYEFFLDYFFHISEKGRTEIRGKAGINSFIKLLTKPIVWGDDSYIRKILTKTRKYGSEILLSTKRIDSSYPLSYIASSSLITFEDLGISPYNIYFNERGRKLVDMVSEILREKSDRNHGIIFTMDGLKNKNFTNDDVILYKESVNVSGTSGLKEDMFDLWELAFNKIKIIIPYNQTKKILKEMDLSPIIEKDLISIDKLRNMMDSSKEDYLFFISRNISNYKIVSDGVDMVKVCTALCDAYIMADNGSILSDDLAFFKRIIIKFLDNELVYIDDDSLPDSSVISMIGQIRDNGILLLDFNDADLEKYVADGIMSDIPDTTSESIIRGLTTLRLIYEGFGDAKVFKPYQYIDKAYNYVKNDDEDFSKLKNRSFRRALKDKGLDEDLLTKHAISFVTEMLEDKPKTISGYIKDKGISNSQWAAMRDALSKNVPDLFESLEKLSSDISRKYFFARIKPIKILCEYCEKNGDFSIEDFEFMEGVPSVSTVLNVLNSYGTEHLRDYVDTAPRFIGKTRNLVTKFSKYHKYSLDNLKKETLIIAGEEVTEKDLNEVLTIIGLMGITPYEPLVKKYLRSYIKCGREVSKFIDDQSEQFKLYWSNVPDESKPSWI